MHPVIGWTMTESAFHTKANRFVHPTALHDLAVGSYVVRTGEEEGFLPRMWNGHLAVVVMIFLIAAITPAGLGRMLNTTTVAELLPAYRAILNAPEVATAQLVQGTNYFWDSKNGKRTTSYVVATARLKYPSADESAEAKKLAQIILEKDRAAEQRDVIKVVLGQGWDIGIASGFRSRPFQLFAAAMAHADEPLIHFTLHRLNVRTELS